MVLSEEHISSLVGQQGSDDGLSSIVSTDVEESEGFGGTEGMGDIGNFDIGTDIADNAVEVLGVGACVSHDCRLLQNMGISTKGIKSTLMLLITAEN